MKLFEPFTYNFEAFERELNDYKALLANHTVLKEREDILPFFNSVGEPHTHSYCFIEFEDADQNSVFVSKGKKYKSEFSPRLEHGFSQIVDWFYKLENLQNTLDMNERFGSYQIHYEGLLIIGRDQFVTDAEMKRLKWRINNTVINSKHIYCYTYDQLHHFFDKRLNYLRF